MTKIELAQAIITEVYQMTEMASRNDKRVIRRSHFPKDDLECQYRMAVNAAKSVGRTVIPMPD